MIKLGGLMGEVIGKGRVQMEKEGEKKENELEITFLLWWRHHICGNLQ